MQNMTITLEEFNALIAERDTLRGELRVVTVERDLLQERIKAFLHQLFAARSEARGTDQRDMFLNEAEALAPTSETPVAQEGEPDDGIEIAGHTRKKRGRKPLDPALPREVIRHELPEAERICGHDGTALVEIGVEISEQLDIIPQQVRVIQHQLVKYACPCCDQGIKVTPAPARIIPKGLLTEAALAWVRHHQFAARPSAGCRSGVRRRDSDSGVERIWARGADKELSVGADGLEKQARRCLHIAYRDTNPNWRATTVVI
jgi:hypothetical protein